MRFKIRNRLTGSIMEVDESRVSEYVSKGHILLDKPEDPKPAEEPKPKKKGTKK